MDQQIFKTKWTLLSSWFPGSLLLFLTENVVRDGSLFNENIASVFLKLSALEMNLTSSSLVLSDQLEFVVHLLLSSVLPLRQVSLKPWVFEKNQSFPLAPVFTAVKLAFYVILHLRSPSLQCFLLSHNLSVSVTGYRTTTWHQFFQNSSISSVTRF